MFPTRIGTLSGVLLITLLAAVPRVCLAQDFTFSKVNYAAAMQTLEVPVILSLTDAKVTIQGKPGNKRAKGIGIEIPYSAIDSMSFTSASRQRLGEGGALAGISLGASTVVMATRTRSYWLGIKYHEGDAPRAAILQLHKSDYDQVLAALKSRCGKEIEILDATTSNELLPVAGSRNIDQVVPFPADRVAAALRPAMESYECKVTKARKDRVVCERPRAYSERTGAGAEKVTATLTAMGSGTRVRIETGKGMLGRLGKRNWSTPIYEAMLKALAGS